MSISTSEEQWRSFASNLGTWEGNLCQYDPDGKLEGRQGSVLFIYVDTKDDEKNIKNKKAPSTIKFRLYRCGDQSEAKLVFLQGMDLAGKGMVFDPKMGHMCTSAGLSLQSGMVVEQLLNCRDSNGNIVGRARLVTMFDAERLRKFSVFRERGSGVSYDIIQPNVEQEVVDNDVVGGEVEATLERLCGKWDGHMTRLRVVGNEVVSSVEDYVRKTSVDGSEVRIEGVVSGSGTISEDGKTVLFVDGARMWRMVFLGGGVTAMTSLAIGNNGEEWFVELGWLTREDRRLGVCRRFVGLRWVESWFIDETRESGSRE